MIKTPVAIGSSVPACPTFLILKDHAGFSRQHHDSSTPVACIDIQEIRLGQAMTNFPSRAAFLASGKTCFRTSSNVPSTVAPEACL